MLEKDLERYFVKRITAMGGKAYKFSSPSHRGVSDRIVCLPNVTWFIELKKPGGRLSVLQRIFADDMKALGQLYACLWTKEQIDEWLNSANTKT